MKAKRAIPLTILPVLIGLGGCSSSSNNGPGPTNDGGHATLDGATVDGSSLSNLDSGSDGNNNSTSSTDDGNETTPYAAILNGYNVLPMPVTTGASGTAQLTLQGDYQTLDFTLSITGLSSAVTAVNLHVGSAVDVSSVANNWTSFGPDAGGAGSFNFSGQVTLNAAEQAALTADQLYFDVFTANYPNGEVRGQVTPPGATVLVANLTGSQEVPAVMSAYSAAASFVLSADGSSVMYHVSPGNGLTTSEISGISWGQNIAGEAASAGSATGLQTNTDGTIDINSPAPWLDGQIYMNIATQAHPNGELRGQVIFPAETLFATTLHTTPAAASSSNTGAAEVILDPTGTTVRYVVDTSSAALTKVTLNFGGGAANVAGDGGADGGADGGSSPAASDAGATDTYNLSIVGMQASNEADGGVTALSITASDITQLKAGNAWILVDTTSYATGELEGSLTQE